MRVEIKSVDATHGRVAIELKWRRGKWYDLIWRVSTYHVESDETDIAAAIGEQLLRWLADADA